MTSKAVILGIFGGLATGLIHQLGEKQPFDLVMVHKNPTTTTLSNIIDDTVANHTVVILEDGVARPNLKLNIDLKNKHNVVLLSTASQNIKIQVGELPEKTIALVADVPQILTIDVVLGAGELVLPVMETKSFFDLAVDDEEQPSTAFWTQILNADYIDGQFIYTGGNVEFLEIENSIPAFLVRTEAFKIGDVYQMIASNPSYNGQSTSIGIFISQQDSDITSMAAAISMFSINPPVISNIDLLNSEELTLDISIDESLIVQLEVIETGLRFSSLDSLNNVVSSTDIEYQNIENLVLTMLVEMPTSDENYNYSLDFIKIKSELS